MRRVPVLPSLPGPGTGTGCLVALVLALAASTIASCTATGTPGDFAAARIQHSLASLPGAQGAQVQYTDRPNVGRRLTATVAMAGDSTDGEFTAVSAQFARERRQERLAPVLSELLLTVGGRSRDETAQWFAQQDFDLTAAQVSAQIGRWRELVRTFGPSVSGTVAARSPSDPASVPFRQKFSVALPPRSDIRAAYQRLASTPGADDPDTFWAVSSDSRQIGSAYGLPPSSTFELAQQLLAEQGSELPAGTPTSLGITVTGRQLTVDVGMQLEGAPTDQVPMGQFLPSEYRSLVWPLLTAQTRTLAATGDQFTYRATRLGTGATGPDGRGGPDFFVQLSPGQCMRPVDDNHGGWWRDLRNYYFSLPNHLSSRCP